MSGLNRFIQFEEERVEEYNNYISLIRSLHKECSESVNWNSIINMPKPIKPLKSNKFEEQSGKELETFKPSISDKIFGLMQEKIKKLALSYLEAKMKDQQDFDKLLEEYNTKVSDWEKLQEIAKGVLEKNDDSYADAITYYASSINNLPIGTNIQFHTKPDYVDIDLIVNGEDTMLTYECKLTSTGKLSKKDLTKTKFYELYQDHICSSVLRLSREMYALLPIDIIRINAIRNIINSTTGHREDQTILSVIIPREMLNQINFENIDPSDSMKNFTHNMGFNKNQGFSAINKVDLPL